MATAMTITPDINCQATLGTMVFQYKRTADENNAAVNPFLHRQQTPTIPPMMPMSRLSTEALSRGCALRRQEHAM